MTSFDASPAETVEEAPVVISMNDHEANKKRQYPTNFIKTSKYMAITFIFVNLWHQFHKVGNVYFLINAAVSLIPDVAPISPFTAISPLVFVLGVAAAKDGYEDFLRHRADDRANSIPAHVVRKDESGKYQLTEVESKDVQVGDIMRMQLGDEIRADVAVFSSSLREGAAFIETCNLDGETNLKNRKAKEETWHLNSVESFTAAHVEIRTGNPDPGLLSWAAVITVDGTEVAIGIEQFLYRSSILRNTDHAWGVVVYAGVDTKMFRNLQEKPHKMSNLDAKLNYLILVSVIIELVCLVTLATASVVWSNNHKDHWYIKYYLDKQTGFELWIYRFCTYFILMSYMIPISLFVTIELCKVAQAKFMEWDAEMLEWMNKKWVGCHPNTSDLNEQLSAVRFIFSDKTGTLTENVMRFLQGNIVGLPVDANNWDISKGYLRDSATKEAAEHYFKSLALCHTVQPFDDPHSDHGFVFEGSSPDEVALVKAAAIHHYLLESRTTKEMAVKIENETKVFTIMATLEFTPDRKMMSMVLREPDGKIVMYTKGADSFVIPRLHAGEPNKTTLPGMKATLKEMANLGLRTLLVCRRPLTEAQFNEWNPKFLEAGKQLVNRSAKVDEVCLELEKDLLIVGATAIEDKLQDRVPETLRFFLDAGVVVWMLTGDKRETAVTIAATSSLCNPLEDAIIHIDIGDMPFDCVEAIQKVQEQLRECEQCCNEGGRNVSFVVDGVALMVAMKNHFDLFLKVSQQVRSAVCCRLTPLQKANVVGMFQKATGSTALAIGDGANDVSMIQEGRVGVGIVGLEGAQAALAADYAIPRFKHLRRLCVVHGRYSLVRNALCVCFSFYKNILLATSNFLFAFYTGFSGQTMIDGWLLTNFNIMFTSLPPLLVGIFEKDLDADQLIDKPELYTEVRNGAFFNNFTVLQWFAEGFSHAIIMFFVMQPSRAQLDYGGQMWGLMQFGTITMCALVFLALARLIVAIKYWIATEVWGIVFSFVVFIAWLCLYAAFPVFLSDTTFYLSTFYIVSDTKLWLYILLFAAGLLIPIDLAFMWVARQFNPTLRDKTQDAAAELSAAQATE